MIPKDKEFIIALIEESQDALDDLKEAIQSDDKQDFFNSLNRLSSLRIAAQKWMNEDH